MERLITSLILVFVRELHGFIGPFHGLGTRETGYPALKCYLLAKSYLKTAADKADTGLKLGVVFKIVNIVLDFLVLVLALKAGFRYFVSLTVWLGYLMLCMIPWIAGRSWQRTQASRE